MNRSRLLLVLALVLATAAGLLFGARRAYAAGSTFIDVGPFVAPLTAVAQGSVAWGDYNSDGNLDILITGRTNLTGHVDVSKIYKNNGDGTFVEATIADSGLARVAIGSVAWGDYNSDGKPDILLTGETVSGPVSKIYRNNGDGSFSDIGAGLTGVEWSSVAWGDYNSDGKPDILLTGLDNSAVITKIYQNNGDGTFTEDTTAESGLARLNGGSVAWGDYNSDGRPDILITGAGSVPISKIYRNNGGSSFSEDTTAESSLTPVTYGSVAWGDYNSDGRPDILLTGRDASLNPVSKIFRNNGDGTFSDIAAGLTSVYGGSVAWDDYNSDGKPDILLTGYGSSGFVGKIYENSGTTFTEDPAADNSLAPASHSSVAWGDYNSDGKPDILLTGINLISVVGKVYRNVAPTANTIPNAPSGLSASFGSGRENLRWNAASDLQTTAAALSYNLRVGTSPGGSDVVSPLSLANGTRLVPRDGNVGEHTSYGLTGLHAGTYYWSVQAVDSGFAGSPFATERTLIVSPTPATGRVASARLTRTSFRRAQAAKVKLTCKFSPKSKVFRYVLSIKKGKKWAVVRNVRKTGSFTKLTRTIKQLFAGKPVKRGTYRLKLSADKSSKTLRFKVT